MITGTRHRRLANEARQLAVAFPRLELAADDSWLVIPDFRLPSGWTPPRTTVLVVPPLNYPEAGPDGFYLAARLSRIVNGRLVQPGHYFGKYKNPYAAAGYHWYCLEDQASCWDPHYDSLVTFVEAIRTYLGTPD